MVGKIVNTDRNRSIDLQNLSIITIDMPVLIDLIY
jgi:hypothetical protein